MTEIRGPMHSFVATGVRSIAAVAPVLFVACGRANQEAAPSRDAGGDVVVVVDSGVDGDTPLTPQEFETQAALADCAFMSRCGVIATSERAACERAVTSGGPLAAPPYSIAEAHAAGRVGFDVGAARACLEARRSRGCPPDVQLAVAAICDRVYPPAVAAGGACQARRECIHGHCARGANARDGCPGACAPFVATGEACSTATPCAPTDVCDSSSHRCLARVGEGESCGSNGPLCRPGLFCKGAGDTTRGVCGAAGKKGESCGFTLFGSDCLPGLFCDDASGKNVCSERLVEGASCGSFVSCVDGLDCVGLAFDASGNVTQRGACAPFLDLGASCDPSRVEAGCTADARCSSSKTCAPSGRLDGDCSASGSGGSCGDGLYCEGGTQRCKPRLPLAAACTPTKPGDDNPCVASTQCDAASRTCSLICR